MSSASCAATAGLVGRTALLLSAAFLHHAARSCRRLALATALTFTFSTSLLSAQAPNAGVAAGAATPAGASANASNAKPPPAQFSVLNSPDRPIEWGGVLAVGIAGELPARADDAAQWRVFLNGVKLGVANVIVGPTSNARPAQPGDHVYQLVLSRFDFSARVADKSAGDVAAATIEALAPDRTGVNEVIVQLEFAGAALTPRPVANTEAASNRVKFRLAHAWEWIVGIAAILLLATIMFVAGRRGAVLRDERPLGAPVNERLYSLGRTQLAFWITMIVGGFIFLYITTGQFWGLLNPTALALLGISAATTALSGVADAAPNPAAALSAPPSPQKHVGFLADIISDAHGVNIHRVQMVIWTVVFGVVFVKQLLTQFCFPEFDATTFGLMGISSATYVWFKRTEP